MQDIPVAFAEEVSAWTQVQKKKIAQEENVPPTIFTLWLKESGGRRRNPANGEGLVVFIAGLKVEEVISPRADRRCRNFASLRECARIHVHNRLELPLHTRHQILMS